MSLSEQQPSVLFSVIVRVASKDLTALPELLLCLLAQDCEQFEVILVPCDNAKSAEIDCLVPTRLRPRSRVLQPATTPVATALKTSTGLYASIVSPDALVSDNWISTFLRAASNRPGCVIRCFASTQLWTKAEAPLTNITTTYSVGAIEPQYCTRIGTEQLRNCNNTPPTMSWAFPKFAVDDFGLMLDETSDDASLSGFFRDLCDLCDIEQVEETTSIERTWTTAAIAPTAPLVSRGRIRQLVPPELKEPARRLLRKTRTLTQ